MNNKYFNREINWLEFDLRVLEEAMDERHPLLEQVKFLSIFHSNLDEFFMIRVSGLKEQVESGLLEPSEDGLTAIEQLAIIRDRVLALNEVSSRYFRETLMLRLAQHEIYLYDYSDLNDSQKARLKDYFEQDVFPVLTPLGFDPGHPFPHISNLSLNLAVVIREPEGGEHFARVKIPATLPRFVPVELPEEATSSDGTFSAVRKRGFVWLEQVVAANLGILFEGVDVVESYPFRVIRDADLEIREDEAGDLLQTIEQSLQRRRFGSVINLSVESRMPARIRDLLIDNLEIEPGDVYSSEVPMGQSDLIQLYDLDLPQLKDQPFRPHTPPTFRNASSIFSVLRSQDIFLHHPYDDFGPVVDFISAAANDKKVLAIKQTIYRVGSNSPIVEALARAALNGKQVSVLVELKARFDEENNIEWARALEKAGVHVVYGSIETKTHCKIALVVRKDNDGIRRYVHLGTGNYNVKTARIYTDMGLMTCRPDLGADASILFNSLTGYSIAPTYRKLLVSPHALRQGLLDRIEREIAHARAGRVAHLIFKINALVDFSSIDALYRASQAGVKVDLIVRGSCSLVPGVPGLSENIRVISIVGRFLEHSRIYYFRNGEEPEVYLGSADLMQRNLDRRVETLFPIEDPSIRQYIIEDILPAYLKDNQHARLLNRDGTYERLIPAPGETPFDVQSYFLQHYLETEVKLQPVGVRKEGLV
jgi:polyphosphate kinase